MAFEKQIKAKIQKKGYRINWTIWDFNHINHSISWNWLVS